MKPWNQNSQVKLGKTIQNNCIWIILQKIWYNHLLYQIVCFQIVKSDLYDPESLKNGMAGQ